MESRMTLIAVIILHVAVISGAFGLRLDVTPARYTEESITGQSTGRVQISCLPDSCDVCEDKYIWLLEISKDGGKPLAFIGRQFDVTYGDGVSKSYKAHGNIADKDGGETYLNLTIYKPQNEDAGTFECQMHYFHRTLGTTKERVRGNLTVEIFDVHDVIKNLMKEMADLKKQLRVQETQVSQEITRLANTTETLLEKSENLETKTENLETKTENLESKTENLESKMENLETKKGKLETDSLVNLTQTLVMESDTLRKDIAVLNDTLTYNSAFSASLTGNPYVTVPVTHVFIFDDVLLRHGEGYDSKTGTYTAPRLGMYVFHLSLRSYDGQYGGASIQANGVEVARVQVTAHSRDWGYQSAASAVVDLNPGDQVNTVASSIARSWRGSKDSLFSGYLIKSYT